MKAKCPYCKNSWEAAGTGITNCPRCGNAVVVKAPDKPSPLGFLRVIPKKLQYVLFAVLIIVLIILILNMTNVIPLF